MCQLRCRGLCKHLCKAGEQPSCSHLPRDRALESVVHGMGGKPSVWSSRQCACGKGNSLRASLESHVLRAMAPSGSGSC